MVDSKYIVFLYYEYNHNTNIIVNDKNFNKLINLCLYESITSFFSQLEGRRYFSISICNPFIYKLISNLKFPYIIDSIIKVIPINNEYLIKSLTDSDGFIKAPFDSMNEEDYQLSKYEDYILSDSIFLNTLYLSDLNENNYLVRIYGKYEDKIPTNFLVFEDLSINISLKCK